MTEKIDTTLQQRGSKYGPFEDNARVIFHLKKAIEIGPTYNTLLPEHLEAYHMIFHKIARSVCGDCMYQDNIHDIVGYAKLLEDFIEKENMKKDNMKKDNSNVE